MAKQTARFSVTGVDLKEMRARAIEQLGELSDDTWAIVETELSTFDQEADRNGLARRWNAYFTLEADMA